MPASKPIVENETWNRLVAMNPLLREALMNPNTDFMTKLLFDARILSQRKGKELTHWSNLIVKTKLALHEKKGLALKQIASKLKAEETDLTDVIAYLKGMAEIKEEKGKYSLNYNNPFSKPFQG